MDGRALWELGASSAYWVVSLAFSQSLAKGYGRGKLLTSWYLGIRGREEKKKVWGWRTDIPLKADPNYLFPPTWLYLIPWWNQGPYAPVSVGGGLLLGFRPLSPEILTKKLY